MAAVSITGSSGIQVSGSPTVTPYHAVGGGPPELKTNQWGIQRFDLKPRSEERA